MNESIEKAIIEATTALEMIRGMDTSDYPQHLLLGAEIALQSAIECLTKTAGDTEYHGPAYYYARPLDDHQERFYLGYIDNPKSYRDAIKVAKKAADKRNWKHTLIESF